MLLCLYSGRKVTLIILFYPFFQGKKEKEKLLFMNLRKFVGSLDIYFFLSSKEILIFMEALGGYFQNFIGEG